MFSFERNQKENMMKKLILKNTFFLFSSQGISRLIGFLYFIFLARVLSIESFGIYTFTLAYVYNFFPVADFGLERLVLKDISRDYSKSQFYFSRFLPLRFLLSLFSLILIIFIALLINQPLWQIKYFLIFGVSIIPFNITHLIVVFQTSKEKMHYLSMVNIMQILFTALIGVLLVYLNAPLGVILLSFFISYLIVFIIFVLMIKKIDLKLEWKIDWKFCRQSIAQSWQYALLLILATFYLRISVVMVGLLKGPEMAGIYGSSYKFIEALILIPGSVALALFPLSSRLYVQDKNKLRSIYLRSLVVLFLISLPIALIFWQFPNQIIKYSFGSKYLGADVVYPILSLAIILFFVNSLPGNIIQNSEKLIKFLPFAVLNFLVGLVFCLILIPKYSIVGAAWAVVGGEAFGFLVNNIFVYLILREKHD